MKTLNELIRKNKNNKFNTSWLHKTPALIASIFSVLFALSIIIELSNVVSGIALILTGVFIVLFLIQNEIFKVKEIKKVFKGNKPALIPFAITFILSVSLSTIGIYFWTNKTQSITDNINIEKSILIKTKNQFYNNKIDSIQNIKYESTPEYNSLIKTLDYWKSRRAMDIDELKSIRANIKDIEHKIDNGRNNHITGVNSKVDRYNKLLADELKVIDTKTAKTKNTSSTNNFISYIFFTLILVTEFAIIILNKNIANEEIRLDEFSNNDVSKLYIVGRNILESLYMTQKNSSVNINNAKYSYANKDNILAWEEISSLYNNYIQIGILDSGELVNNVLTNKLLLSEGDALIKFDAYFEKMFKIG